MSVLDSIISAWGYQEASTGYILAKELLADASPEMLAKLHNETVETARFDYAVVDGELVRDDDEEERVHWYALPDGSLVDDQTYLQGEYLSREEILRIHEFLGEQGPFSRDERLSEDAQATRAAIARLSEKLDEDEWSWLVKKSGVSVEKAAALAFLIANGMSLVWAASVSPRLLNGDGLMLHKAGVPVGYANEATAGMRGFGSPDESAEDGGVEPWYPEAIARLIEFYRRGIPAEAAAILYQEAVTVGSAVELVQSGIVMEYLSEIAVGMREGEEATAEAMRLAREQNGQVYSSDYLAETFGPWGSDSDLFPR